jgi:hypothetical protein
MNNQVLSKPELKIADFYATPSEVSPEAFERASNLLENGLQVNSVSDLVFLAGIKQAFTHELNLNEEGDLESILLAAAQAGFEVEVAPVEMK